MNTQKYVRCCLSEVGYNNFWYPTTTEAIVAIEKGYKVMPWLGGAPWKLTPIKVHKSYVLPIDFDKNTLKNSIPTEKNNYTVVWVKDNLLPLKATTLIATTKE